MNRVNLISIFILTAFPFYPVAQIVMQEKSQEIKLVHSLSSWEVGCGVSFQDFNNDGWDDITLGTESGRPISFYINEQGTLLRIPPLVNNLENVRQVLWTDYDNDGDKDLYISAYDGVSKLYRNEGALTFRDITFEANLPSEKQRAIGATWGDVNRDGWLDLYYSIRKNIQLGTDENQNRLFLNIGGTFEEVSDSYDVKDKGRLPFCASFLDINKDLWPDIYIANDRSKRNTLYLNKGTSGFEDISELSNAGIYMDAMCVTPVDINNDEQIDIYIANTGQEGNKLLINETHNNEDPSFSEKAKAYNLTYNHTGWSSVFYDGDNDGDLDLFVSGTQYLEPDFSSQFYENENGTYSVIHQDQLVGKGSFASAKGDLNNDGLIDILVQMNSPEPYQFWRNENEPNLNFVKLELEGVVSNREGIGSHIRLFYDDNIQYQQHYSNTGYLGQDSDVLHFGLGTHTIVDSVEVRWPTGHIDKFYGLEAGETHLIKEGASSLEIKVDSEIEIYSELTVNTNEENISKSISISPNPASNAITIAGEHPIEMVEIINLSGIRTVRNYIEDNNGIRISIADLHPGMYIAKISIGSKIYSKVFIKI